MTTNSMQPARPNDTAERFCDRCGCRGVTPVPLQAAHRIALVCPNCGRQRIPGEDARRHAACPPPGAGKPRNRNV